MTELAISSAGLQNIIISFAASFTLVAVVAVLIWRFGPFRPGGADRWQARRGTHRSSQEPPPPRPE